MGWLGRLMLPLVMMSHGGRVLLTMVIRMCRIHCRLGKEIVTKVAIVPLRDPPRGRCGRGLKIGMIWHALLLLLLMTVVMMHVGLGYTIVVVVGQGSAAVGVIM